MSKTKTIEIDLGHIEQDLKLYIDAVRESDIEINEDNRYSHEPFYQIKEGRFYDYEFSAIDYRLRCRDAENIVQQRARSAHVGRIAPNIYVGTLSLDIFNVDRPDKIWVQKLEVQSIKVDYRKDYQYMLNSIAGKCADLIIQANSPVSHSFETDYNTDSQSLYQRFAFIRSMINTEEFDDAINRIITSPTTRWTEETEEMDVRKVKRFSNKEVRQLINANNRTSLSKKHPLYSAGFQAIATRINSNKKKESVDTPENRFIKHALETFLKFCLDIGSHSKAGDRLKSESEDLAEKLENKLQLSLFKEVSKPKTLRLNSPTLQKKEGYREILSIWLKFDLAAKLVWSGGDEVYSGGKKDIATLYEYWLFFKLLDVLKSIFDIDHKDLDNLIVPSSNELSLQLKQGQTTALDGTYTKRHRNLRVRFNYNKSFRSNDDFTKVGSWTTTLRPDYTLSIWPEGIEDTQAEEQEQIVHIHFDAKYKIANINKIIDRDKDEQGLSDEKKDNLKGVYKNADLLKMHAYKDAIRRTGGAYLLYPGSKDKSLKGFHEVLPGLGAFPVKPSAGTEETIYLERFIKDVLEHFLNNASQRENLASKAYQIHENATPNIIKESIPEYLNGKKIIPDETYVLVGFYNSPEQYEWIAKGKYNFRMGPGNGSLILDKETVSASYLLLHTHGDASSSRLWKISSKGPRVYSKENLLKKGYPMEPSQDYYLVIDIEEVQDLAFTACAWRFKELDNYSTGHASAKPFTASLTELMGVKE
jgi:predicted component of viral defense system (DUF524 family)